MMSGEHMDPVQDAMGEVAKLIDLSFEFAKRGMMQSSHICDKAFYEYREALKDIDRLKSQLAARNQAAEAMGVLEEMLRDEQGDMRQLDIYYHPNAGYSVILTHANREELADGYSDDLIEAVLKAGGESQ